MSDPGADSAAAGDAHDGAATPSAGVLAPAAPEPPSTGDVVMRYRARMRRQLRWYFAVVAVVVIALVAFAVVILRRGEAAHAHLHVAAVPAAALPSGAPAATQALAWRSDDTTAIGEPYYKGTVVTYDQHTVSGRNAATGARLWWYTRTDVSVCSVAEQDGKTIALFDHNGNCDEMTTLDTRTGQRVWYRTLDSNARPTNGRPLVAINQYTILLTTAEQVHAIDPSGGI
ncbi:MAG: PQQ-binding-like beta-propeller repeat protein, partial [Actinobacteria bacterium]|nr:PQQ-binding-like beta-propeller repeat protein [Actinomycetota bacterium]